MDENINFSVIIPAYNESLFLPNTLSNLFYSIDQLGLTSAEIIIVDNNSTDNTAYIASSMGAKLVFEENQNIAAARNAGAKSAQSNNLIFLDADTLVGVDLLRLAVKKLADPEVVGGGALIESSTNMNWKIKIGLAFWNTLSYQLKWAAGCFLFCKRDIFFELGGYDEQYYASEDIRLSRALKKYAKRNNKLYIILPIFVKTSMRKLEWFTWKKILIGNLKLLFFPFLLKKKNHCDFWYKR